LIHKHSIDSIPKDKHEAFHKSDSIKTVDLRCQMELKQILLETQKIYLGANEDTIVEGMQKLANAVCEQLGAQPTEVEIAKEIPYDDYGPLHGYYLPKEPKWPALIVLCLLHINTDDRITFKHLVEVFVHELVHHLDFALYDLGDSFHTDGFDKRQKYLIAEFVGMLEE